LCVRNRIPISSLNRDVPKRRSLPHPRACFSCSCTCTSVPRTRPSSCNPPKPNPRCLFAKAAGPGDCASCAPPMFRAREAPVSAPTFCVVHTYGAPSSSPPGDGHGRWEGGLLLVIVVHSQSCAWPFLFGALTKLSSCFNSTTALRLLDPPLTQPSPPRKRQQPPAGPLISSHLISPLVQKKK
jgi:hypothetical protein